MAKQLWHFVVHLRLHYQFFILSGGYLMGSLFVPDINWEQFWLQFLNVHVLLFGGATAYNSYWDKDEGPIGGLKSPPKMTKWMWTASLLIQFAGLLWAYQISFSYFIIYGVSFVLFWLYSTPHARWKGKPLLSLVAIGFSTGTNSFLLGYLAAGGENLGLQQGLTALGVGLIILSLYPASQIYQIKEDEKRGDVTFAMKYGLKAVQYFYTSLFLVGVILLTIFLYLEIEILGIIFWVLCMVSFSVLSFFIFRLKGKEEEYGVVMKIKFLASFGFVGFILATLVISNLI